QFHAVHAATAAGAAPFSDHRGQSPGRVHSIRARDLPRAHASESADNPPRLVPRPKDAWPQAPAGFAVQLYAGDLSKPRLMRTAPNGDVFVAASDEGAVLVFRGITPAGTFVRRETFAKGNGKGNGNGKGDGLKKPFGIAFYPPGPEPRWVYVANTDSIVRFPYRPGDLKARGAAEKLAAQVPGGGLLRGGGHWSRDVAFSLDGKKMYVSVGSRSNNDDPDDTPDERNRAVILEFNPDGSNGRVYASGIRNPVGIAVQPRTGLLWTSVNERDLLGDDLVPDYITSVKDGGFYGWPWYYIGANPDPRHQGKHPELKDKTIVPDVLLQPHNASLQLTFYEGQQFPAAYRGDIFAAQHGSWNRRERTGYEVIRVPLERTERGNGTYEDFLTGFVTPRGEVWGRPVGVTVAADGSLLVSDDGSGSIWRVSHAVGGGNPPSAAPAPSR
ncbi:MAG: PQQ-dependent sugar dehydrogenase, partial [Bacteroidota bacterium]